MLAVKLQSFEAYYCPFPKKTWVWTLPFKYLINMDLFYQNVLQSDNTPILLILIMIFIRYTCNRTRHNHNLITMSLRSLISRERKEWTFSVTERGEISLTDQWAPLFLPQSLLARFQGWHIFFLLPHNSFLKIFCILDLRTKKEKKEKRLSIAYCILHGKLCLHHKKSQRYFCQEIEFTIFYASSFCIFFLQLLFRNLLEWCKLNNSRIFQALKEPKWIETLMVKITHILKLKELALYIFLITNIRIKMDQHFLVV